MSGPRLRPEPKARFRCCPPRFKLVDYVHVMSKGVVVHSSLPDELWANEEVKSNYLGL